MWETRIPILAVLALLTLTFAGGCGGEKSPPGEIPSVPTGARIDDHRWLGESLTIDNLTVWPVHTDRPLDVGDFLTLEEAEGQGLAAVREVGGGASNDTAQQVANGAQQEIGIVTGNEPDERQGQLRQAGQVLQGSGAVVGTLVIENRGDLPILVCAGTIVKGGQQDRQIGQDFVIAAKTSVPVEAFCVEAGRWHVREGDGSTGLGFTSHGQGMAIKSVRASGQYEQDQGKVWAAVGKALESNDIQGTTTLVAANEAVGAEVLARRAGVEKQVADHFASLARGPSAPVGFAYAVDGKPVTVRAFAHERLLRGHLPAFVKAMCLEAELATRARGDAAAPPEATAADVVALVEALRIAQEREQRTAAGNWNVYRVTEAGYNGACRIRLPGIGPDKVVLTEDWTAR